MINPKILPCGTFLWGYALSYDHGKNMFRLKQEPVLGMLAAGNTHESNTNKLEKNPDCTPLFFVPLKRDKDPIPENCAWSRPVEISSRHYAETEGEARTEYNSLINKLQEFHENKIKELEEMKL